MKIIFYVLALYAAFQGCYSAANQPRATKKSTSIDRSTSSVVLPVTGNVYPRGYYHVTVNIGNPPKPYWLDIDTGSDLTWLQCDAPCTQCTPAPHKLYKPDKDLVTCMDPLCASVHWPEQHDCGSPKEQCDYEVVYADNGSSVGVLVTDSFPLQFINGSIANPRLAFGKHYSLGTAELNFGGKASGVKGLHIVFDSGSTYTYLTAQAYKALVSMIIKDMKGKQVYIANEDKSLPVCWKGSKPFKYIHDVKNLFKPLKLSFAKNVEFQLDPEAYLIISKHGNACLGILNGSEVGLESINIIGDVSLQDKIIIYDNEKQRIGWAPANCNELPNLLDDGDPDNGGLCKPYEPNLGILKAYSAAKWLGLRTN
ncbi:aspartic proteinase Asp1-like isoform X2 [Cynara cardunculus var. scolymus]|uniref:aspartic proteinase Asp1-like isoform X2 n=1 Tax=Cynara cardunculus var. scolymus TaxID=59895 RepID=UPI000D624A2F|nr:aspartic proteinase Asp1-like isoform X2 [Cynara cardunculus var. scolymus]